MPLVSVLALVIAWTPEVGATVVAGPRRQTFVRPEVGAGAFIPGGDDRTSVAGAFRLAHGWSVARRWQLGGMSSLQWTPADDRAVASLYAHLVGHEHTSATQPGYRLDLALGIADAVGPAASEKTHLGPGWMVGFGYPVWSSKPHNTVRLEAGDTEWMSKLVVSLSYEGAHTHHVDHALSLMLSFDLERFVFEY